MLLLSLTSLKIPQHKAEGIELRLDCMSTIDRTALRAFLLQVDQPVMLTLRKTSQGGLFTGSEEQRLAYLEDLLYLHPSFVDIEYDTEPAFV